MSSNNKFLDRILQNRPLTHVTFWVAFSLIFILLAALNDGSFKEHLINYAALLPAQVLAAYTLVYYQVPKLLLKKKYLLFAISFVVSVYVFAVIARLSVIYIAEPFTRTDFEQESVLEIISDPFFLFAVYFPVVYVIVFLMLAIKIIKERFEARHDIQVLEKEKTTNELKFLKAQIHPHFLFNTLNNLYALTLAKSDLAPKVVVKLSEMLDYMLYQCNEPRIAIEKEIDLLQGYIELEQLRYGDKFELVFNHQVDLPNTKIAPLILLSIVENAFKHGASANPVNPKVHIDLEVKDEDLLFKVFNTKPEKVQQKLGEETHNGIGKSNVNRQLELNYPNKYSLDIEDTKKTYLVTLNVNLK